MTTIQRIFSPIIIPQNAPQPQPLTADSLVENMTPSPTFTDAPYSRQFRPATPQVRNCPNVLLSEEEEIYQRSISVPPPQSSRQTPCATESELRSTSRPLPTPSPFMLRSQVNSEASDISNILSDISMSVFESLSSQQSSASLRDRGASVFSRLANNAQQVPSDSVQSEDLSSRRPHPMLVPQPSQPARLSNGDPFITDRYIPLRKDNQQSFSYQTYTEGYDNAFEDYYRNLLQDALFGSTGSSVFRYNNFGRTSQALEKQRLEKAQKLKKEKAEAREKACLPLQAEGILAASEASMNFYHQVMDANEDFFALATGSVLNIKYLVRNTVISISLESYLTGVDSETAAKEVISSIKFLSSDTIIVGSNKDKLLSIKFNNGGAREVKLLRNGPEADIYSIATRQFLFYAGGEDCVVKTYDLRVSKYLVNQTILDSQVRALAGCVCKILPHASQSILAVGYNDNAIRFYDERKMEKPLKEYKDPKAAVKSLAFINDNIMATGAGTNDKRVVIWDISKDQKVQEFDFGGQISGMEYIKNRVLAVSGGYLLNHTRFFYLKNPSKPLASCQQTKVESGHNEWEDDRVVSSTSNSNMVFTLSTDSIIRMYNFKTLENPKKESLAFSFPMPVIR